VYCLIAAEPQAAEVIKRNLEKSGRYPDWRFEVVTDAGELERWPEQPDVLVVSRFLPGRDPVAVLKDLRRLFPAAHVVLLAGQESETRRAYIRAAERLGFYNVVTGKLPGDPPYTIFVALTQAREPEREGYSRLGEEEEPAPAGEVREEDWRGPAVEPRPPAGREPAEDRRDSRAGSARASAGKPAPDLRLLKEALEAGDLDAVRERLAGVLAALEGSGPEERMERVSERRGVLVLSTANKGGVGKTTVAVGISRALARAGVPTVVIDLDFKVHSLARACGIDTKVVPGIDVLVGRQIRENVLREVIVSLPGGPDVIPGPKNTTRPAFREEELALVLDTLRDMYAVVVADTGAGSWADLREGHPAVAAAFKAADYVLAVVNQSVQSEEDIAEFAPSLRLAEVTPDRIGIVLNSYSPKLHNPRKVEQLFCSGYSKHVKVRPKIEAIIPHAWDEFNLQAYRGTVPGLDDPRYGWHRLAEKIAAMAGYRYRIEQTGAGRPQRKSLLDLFKRR
jgi:MinD-like ATPase involved in chromosome partitioning or flagellar assembly